jgi:hypothetical protein
MPVILDESGAEDWMNPREKELGRRITGARVNALTPKPKRSNSGRASGKPSSSAAAWFWPMGSMNGCEVPAISASRYGFIRVPAD